MTNDLQQARVEAASSAVAEEHAQWGDACGPAGFERVARAVLAAADAVEVEYTKPCTAEIHSWERFRPEQTDSYWIRCKLAGPHEQHEDSDTGLRWEVAGDE